jgi:hypothetical protein
MSIKSTNNTFEQFTVRNIFNFTFEQNNYAL